MTICTHSIHNSSPKGPTVWPQRTGKGPWFGDKDVPLLPGLTPQWRPQNKFVTEWGEVVHCAYWWFKGLLSPPLRWSKHVKRNYVSYESLAPWSAAGLNVCNLVFFSATQLRHLRAHSTDSQLVTSFFHARYLSPGGRARFGRPKPVVYRLMICTNDWCGATNGRPNLNDLRGSPTDLCLSIHLSVTLSTVVEAKQKG